MAGKMISREDKIKPISIKMMNAAFVAAISVFILICIFLFILPAFDKHRNLQIQFSQLKKDLKDKQLLADNLLLLTTKYNQQLELAKKLIFTDKEIELFLQDFANFSSQTGMMPVRIMSRQLTRVPMEPESKEASKATGKEVTQRKKAKEKKVLDSILMLPLTITLQGEYPAAVKFLANLEQYKQLLTVSELKVSPSRKGYPELELNFVLRLYTMGRLEEGK